MSFNLFHYLLSYLLVGGALSALSIFIYARSDDSPLFKTFSFYNLAIAWWCFFSVPAILAYNGQVAVYWCRTFIAGAIFIPTLFLHFAYLLLGYLTKRKYRTILAISYLASFVFLLFDFTPLFIASAEAKQTLRSYTVPGPLFHLHVIHFFIVMFYGEVLFLREYLREKGVVEGRKYLYFFITAFIATVGGGGNYLPVYRLEYPVINPFGTYLILLYAFTVTYIIFKYNFLNVEVIIKKTIIFASLFIVVFGIFVGITLLTQEIIAGGRLLGLAVSSIAIIFVLRPLGDFLAGVTDKYLFQKKYDYRQLLRTFSDEVLTVLDLEKLVSLTVNKLVETVKLENAAIMLHHNDIEEYRIISSAGLGEAEYELSDSEGVVRYLLENKQHVLYEDPGRNNPLRADVQKVMRDLQSALIIPLLLREDMVGILTLGKKKSDEEFTQDDIDILLPLARSLSIAITNAQLFEKLSEAQAQAAQREKMAVIGTLSAGINHEICNPLGIARGQCEMFILNLREGLYKDRDPNDLLEKAQEIMQKVINETDRATVITRKLSSFAKPARGNVEDDVQVKKEIEEVLSLVEHDLKLDNINIVREMPDDLPRISADRKQIQEIFFNILRNAAQSILGSGKITIRARSSDRKVYIEIEDTGIGIRKNDLNQIFNPFFTTKEPGKGTGLGLFIVKQIVERNSGHISVRSEFGKGTTFYINFETAASPKNVGHEELSAK